MPTAASTPAPTRTPAPPTATWTPTRTPVLPTATAKATSTPTTCASDGTCLTSFTASPTVVTLGNYTTLTATTNRDVGSTQWYIDVVDNHNSVLGYCETGTTCAVPVSDGVAEVQTYTAWLSTSAYSITGSGPHSSSVQVSWVSEGGFIKTG
jgi:hypothetical protein